MVPVPCTAHTVRIPTPRLSLPGSACIPSTAPLPQIKQPGRRSQRLSVRAEGRSGGGGFFAGFVVGGAIFGALGFLFAPQISAALLSEDQRLKLPRFLEDEEKDPEATKQDLADKIAQLNSAIDDVSAQLKAQDNGAPEEASSTVATVTS